MAVGYDETTDSFLFVGGRANPQQFISLHGRAFTDHGIEYLSDAGSVYGYGTHYAQMNNELWMLRDDGTGFIVLHTEPPYIATVPPITIPITVTTPPNQFDGSGCLALTETHLFIIGGNTNATQIYDMTSGEWLSAVPQLPTVRMNAGCLIIEDVFYVVGGVDGSSVNLDTIIALDVSDLVSISSQQWVYLQGTLSVASETIKAVAYGTDIIVIGAQNWDLNISASKDVNIIDTTTGGCLLGGSLEAATAESGVIVHQKNHTLFIFGGHGNQKDGWQYMPLPELSTAKQSGLSGWDPLPIPGVWVFVIVLCLVFAVMLLNRWVLNRKEESEQKEKHHAAALEMARVHVGSVSAPSPQVVAVVANEPKIEVVGTAESEEIGKDEEGEREESSTFSNSVEGNKQTMSDAGDVDVKLAQLN